MDSNLLMKSAAFSELTSLMCRFLDGVDYAQISTIDGKSLEDALADLEKSRDRVAKGDKLDLKRFKPMLASLGLEPSRFEAAAIAIHGAAIEVRSEMPELLNADGADRKTALRKAISAHEAVLSFIAARSKAPEGAIQPVLYGGGIPEDLGSDILDDCQTNCTFAAALAFGAALAAALERSLFCAGAAVIPLVAFLCLIIVAVAFVAAGKAADEALEACLASCN